MTLAQDCGAKAMNPQQRDQKLEEGPGRGWSLGELNHRECGKGTTGIIQSGWIGRHGRSPKRLA